MPVANSSIGRLQASQLAAQALSYIGQLYYIERESKDIEAQQRQQL